MKMFTWILLALGAGLFVFNMLAWRLTDSWGQAVVNIPLGISWVFCYTMYRRAQ